MVKLSRQLDLMERTIREATTRLGHAHNVILGRHEGGDWYESLTVARGDLTGLAIAVRDAPTMLAQLGKGDDHAATA